MTNIDRLAIVYVGDRKLYPGSSAINMIFSSICLAPHKSKLAYNANHVSRKYWQSQRITQIYIDYFQLQLSPLR